MILSAGASAQENGNRDSLNRIVRGPYETNGAWDNWFVGVGGGINLFEDGWFGAETTHKTRVAPNIEVYVGKWFTPSVGARVGYSGLRANGWVKTSSVFATEFDESRNMFKEKVNFAYIHGDLMWNISNAFSGYKETRFWNVIPYVSVGLLHGYGADGVKAANNQFAMGAGIYNTLRLSDRVNLTLDARQLIFKGTFNGFKGGIAAMSSISLGVSVNLGKTNWKRAVEVPEGYAPYSIEAVNSLKEESENLLARAEKLAAEKEALARENETVKAENGDLRDAVAAAEGRKLAVSSGAVFFAIGKTELDSKGLFQLDGVDMGLLVSEDQKGFGRLLGEFARKRSAYERARLARRLHGLRYAFDYRFHPSASAYSKTYAFGGDTRDWAVIWVRERELVQGRG